MSYALCALPHPQSSLLTPHLPHTYPLNHSQENHHLAAAFALLQRPGCNFLSGLPDKSLAAFRRQVIEMVLATDMKQHFAMVSLFNTKFGPPAGSSGSKGDCKSGSSLLARRNSMSKIDHSPALTLDDDTLSLVLQMALKVADLGSLAAAADANRKWVLMLEEEMFLQGDKERQAGLPISPLMDRHCSKGGVSRSQTGVSMSMGGGGGGGLRGGRTVVWADTRGWMRGDGAALRQG